MSIETFISICALIVAIVGAVVSSRKSSAEIAKTKVETEKMLREMLNDETEKRHELERKFSDLSVYIGELLAGIDLLIDQITVKHNDTPVWHPNRRKEDK